MIRFTADGIFADTDEELEPIYNKCVEDEHINNFAHEVVRVAVSKAAPLIAQEAIEKAGLKFCLSTIALRWLFKGLKTHYRGLKRRGENEIQAIRIQVQAL